MGAHQSVYAHPVLFALISILGQSAHAPLARRMRIETDHSLVNLLQPRSSSG